MGRRGDGYGSEDHLRRDLSKPRPRLNRAISEAMGVSGRIEWLPFPHKPDGSEREFRAVEFLGDPLMTREWNAIWPTTGTPISWDAVGKAGDAWVLVEAKASWPEFCTPPSGAKGESLRRITTAVNRTKRALGVHRNFTWTGTYYQYANRLTVLRFLHDHGISAHLVGVYFFGDRFPDDTPCPASRQKWEALIEARRLTLGLPERHALSSFEHHVFLRATR